MLSPVFTLNSDSVDLETEFLVLILGCSASMAILNRIGAHLM